MTDPALSKGERRRYEIMQRLKKEGRITLQEITALFGCSEATARRDLDYLARTENVIRTIGGARLEAPGIGKEFSFAEKRERLWAEKEAIARTAAALVEEGDAVGLTGGTTTFLIARELKLRRGITVVTNAVNIAMELADQDGIQVVLTGGVLRGKSFELCGPLALQSVEGLHIGKMFVGIDGISLSGGLTTYSELEAEIDRALMRRSAQTIAVFDHTKVGKSSLFGIAPLDALHACVTDAPPDRAFAGELRKRKIRLYYPESPGDSGVSQNVEETRLS
mgnify:FL=1